MTTSKDKLRSLFLATLMVLSVFAGTVAFSGSVAAAGNLASTGANPNSVVDGEQVNNQQLTFSVDYGAADGNTDDVYVELNENDIVVSSLSPNSASTTDADGISQSITVVDGPDNDGVQETLYFQLSDANGTVSFTVDTAVEYATSSDGALDVNVTAVDSAGANATGSFQPVTIGSGGSVSGFGASLPGGTFTDNTPQATTTLGATQTVADFTFANEGDVTNVTVNATGGNGNIATSSISSVEVELLNASGELASMSAAYNAHNKTVSFGSPVSNVDRIRVKAAISNNAADGEVIDAQVYAENDTDTGFVDTINFQTVEVQQTGFISGRVSDQNNQDIQNATVIVQNGSTGFRKTTSTNAQGEYTIEVPAGTYNVTAEKPGFSTAQPKDTSVQANATTTANFVIRRLLVATTLTATPDNAEELVGETVTFTAVVRDQNGDRLSGVLVNANSPNGDIIFTSGTSDTTDNNGEVTFTVSSNVVVNNAELNFSVDSNPSVNDISTVTFTESGEGSVQGFVDNAETTDPIENASVWAVTDGQYEANTFHTEVNLTAIPGANADSTIWVRLIDNETGAIVDKDEYDVRVSSYNNSTGTVIAGAEGTSIRKVESLNTSDESQGEGFAVIDENADGYVAFNHTRLADKDYYAQVSLNASEVSDQRIADTGAEAFVNVSDVDSAGDADAPANPNADNEVSADDITGTPAVFAPSANLTLAATEQRASASGANLVDSPGFVNNAGVDTRGTNVYGRYVLTRLTSNFQQGRQYVTIATKAGFTTDFADVYVTEDGELVYGENQNANVFLLKPEPVEPDFVNITQIGTHPPLSETGGSPDVSQITPFADQSDATFQRVPRDGTVDVIQIETGVQQESGVRQLNATVDVSLNSTFDGQFLSTVIGGQLVSNDANNTTISISTGADGVATILLETEVNDTTIRRTKDAVLDVDPSVTDSSNVTFVGAVVYETGSVSGIVTNENNNPIVDSVVYAERFEDQSGNEFTIQPVNPIDNTSRQGVRNAMFNLTDVADGTSTMVTGAQLEAFELGNQSAGGFERVSINGTETVSLLTFPSESQGEAQYTLPTVPATARGSGGVDYDLRGVQLDTGQRGIGDTDQGVEVGFTQEANVVIVGATPVDGEFQVSNLAAPSSASPGDTITVTADITNVDPVTATQTVEFRFGAGLLGPGTTFTSQPLTLGPGANDTVTFNVTIPSSTAPGTYNHGVFTADDSETATINITSLAPAAWQVSNVNSPASISQGDTLNVTANVTNIGQAAGSTPVTLEISGTNVSTGAGQVDIVFLIDTSGSMSNEIAAIQSGLTTFTNNLQSQGVDVRYAVVTFADVQTYNVRQNYTSNVTQTQQTLNAISTSGGFEDSYGAMNGSIDDLMERSTANEFFITFTDEDSDTNPSTPTQSELAARLDAEDISLFAVAPPDSQVFDPTLSVGALANATANGQFFNIAEGNFSAKFENQISGAVANASAGQSVTLNGSQSSMVSFTIPSSQTQNLAPGNYTVNVSAGNSTVSVPLTVNAGGPTFTVGNSANPPMDPDNDGVYEDINGDGSVDLIDVSILYNNRNSATVQNNGQFFDFDGSGGFDLVDISVFYNNGNPSATA